VGEEEEEEEEALLKSFRTIWVGYKRKDLSQ
jgi:hypothetical protein